MSATRSRRARCSQIRSLNVTKAIADEQGSADVRLWIGPALSHLSSRKVGTCEQPIANPPRIFGSRAIIGRAREAATADDRRRRGVMIDSGRKRDRRAGAQLP